MRYILSLAILVSQTAFADVTRSYKIHFQGEYGCSAQSAKRATVQQIPYIFSRYVRDVKWKITKHGKAWIQVELAGRKNSINGWLYTIQAETQDAIYNIEEIR